MKIELNLESEFADQVVLAAMKTAIANIEDDCGVPWFSYDKEDEKRKIKKLKKAFKLVSAWFGSKEYDLEELLK